MTFPWAVVGIINWFGFGTDWPGFTYFPAGTHAEDGTVTEVSEEDMLANAVSYEDTQKGAKKKSKKKKATKKKAASTA